MGTHELSPETQTLLDSVSNQTFYYALAGGFAFFGHIEVACAIGLSCMYGQILNAIRKDKKIGQGGVSIVVMYGLYKFVGEEAAWIWFYATMVFFLLGWFVVIVSIAKEK